MFIKMVLNCPFMPTCNDNYLLNSGLDCLLDNILDYGFVHNRQHFFWLGFCCRQKTGAEAGSWNYYFAYFFHKVTDILTKVAYFWLQMVLYSTSLQSKVCILYIRSHKHPALRG